MLLISLNNLHLHNSWGDHAAKHALVLSLHGGSFLLPPYGLHAPQHCRGSCTSAQTMPASAAAWLAALLLAWS